MVVGIADMKMAQYEGMLVTYALGSCIGICLYDPGLRLAALVHVMLPLNMETTSQELGVDESVASFVLPLGMTVNMNGTAIMHIIGAAFIATCAGLEVTPMNYLTMTLLAIAASMGTPAIPAAGSVMLYAVLTGAGFNTELCTLIYSLVLAMNKPCEMVLTTLNVVGDAATTVIVSTSEKEFDKEIYNS